MKRIHKLGITAVLIAVFLTYNPVAAQNKPDTTKSAAPSLESLMQEVQRQYQHNDSLITELKQRQTYLQGYFQALQDQARAKADTTEKRK